MKYLLPCDQCGTEHQVELSQAGENLQCGCGRTLEVPSMRGLRQLQPAGGEPAGAPAARPPAELPRRLILVGGLLLIAIGALVAAYGGLIRSQIQVPEPPPIEDPQAEASIDALSPAQTHRMWTEYRDQGPGPYRLPVKYMAEMTQRYYFSLLLGGLIVAGVGILLAGGALGMPSRRPRPSGPTKRG